MFDIEKSLMEKGSFEKCSGEIFINIKRKAFSMERSFEIFSRNKLSLKDESFIKISLKILKKLSKNF
jgi:hypothetical protein